MRRTAATRRISATGRQAHCDHRRPFARLRILLPGRIIIAGKRRHRTEPTLGALNLDRATESRNIELAVPSDVSTLLERMSGLSLAEMDKAIQELQRVRNFLRNERERLRLEIVEHLRLTQAAMGSAKAVSASVASFGTVAEDFGKSRAAV
jgi:hypothetical protein